MPETERSRTCCFTGHRGIAPIHERRLPALVEKTVLDLLAEGINRFITGGALGFDTLAAETVLRLREKHPALHLTVVAPYLRQADGWEEPDRLRYERIRSGADDFVVLRTRYTRACMRERNREMVDRSGICVAYLLRAPSGTAQTVDYAIQSGVAVIDLAGMLQEI